MLERKDQKKLLQKKKISTQYAGGGEYVDYISLEV